MSSHPAPQLIEIADDLTSDSLSKTVTATVRSYWPTNAPSLYSSGGERKYLNRSERNRVLDAIKHLEPERALFALVLAWTGARISEVLALTPQSIQLDSGLVAFATLKQRGAGRGRVREIPVPPFLLAALSRHFSLSRRNADVTQSTRRLWTFCRMTAWRIIKSVMALAGITGRKACPRGLRHSFGINTLGSGIPITLVQRWMGHARLSTTSIYTNVCGPEEVAFARRFWRAAGTTIKRKALTARQHSHSRVKSRRSQAMLSNLSTP